MSSPSAILSTASASFDVAANSRTYSDIQGLQSIKQLGQVDKQAALKEVSKQFESILVNMMLKNMRSATNVLSEGSYLGGDKVNFYQEMMDDELSVALSAREGLGFADTIARQLGGTRAGAEQSDVKTAADSSVHGIPIDQALFANRIAVQQSRASGVDTLPNQQALATIQPSLTAATAAPVAATTNTRFASPEQFIQSLYPQAQNAARELGVKPETLLAQAALETGWGQHMPSDKQGNHGFNLFGIKADTRWNGASTNVETVEYFGDKPLKVNAAFRSYDSFEQSFNDYVSFVKDQSRYQPALDNAADSSAYIQALHQAGYATDPRYAEKIEQILQRAEFNSALKGAVIATTTDQLPQS